MPNQPDSRSLTPPPDSHATGRYSCLCAEVDGPSVRTVRGRHCFGFRDTSTGIVTGEAVVQLSAVTRGKWPVRTRSPLCGRLSAGPHETARYQRSRHRGSYPGTTSPAERDQTRRIAITRAGSLPSSPLRNACVSTSERIRPTKPFALPGLVLRTPACQVACTHTAGCTKLTEFAVANICANGQPAVSAGANAAPILSGESAAFAGIWDRR